MDTSRYRYVIFLNSSVRGPFLPPYWPVSAGEQLGGNACGCCVAWAGWHHHLAPLLAPLLPGTAPHVRVCLAAWRSFGGLLQRDVHWSKVLTQRLTDKVKLSGSTIR